MYSVQSSESSTESLLVHMNKAQGVMGYAHSSQSGTMGNGRWAIDRGGLEC